MIHLTSKETPSNTVISFLIVSLYLVFSSGLTAKNKGPIKPKKDFIVVIDAGHGGHDTGAQNRALHLNEKDIALAIALKVGNALEKIPGVKVVYTRTKDVFVTLRGRAEVANKIGANLFVSIHLNSVAGRNRTPHGIETYVLATRGNKRNLDVSMRENKVILLEKDYKETYHGFDPNDPDAYRKIGVTLIQEENQQQSILLAYNIQQQVKRVNRGVKDGNLMVLRESYMPGVLVETGFISNNQEARYLNSNKGQIAIAKMIADGIVEYKKSLIPSQGTPQHVPKAAEGVRFKVQIGAGTTRIETKPYNFKGLDQVSRKKEGRLYKYYYGDTTDYLEAQELLRTAQEKGFKSAYIAAFKNGKKMKVHEALKQKID